MKLDDNIKRYIFYFCNENNKSNKKISINDFHSPYVRICRTATRQIGVVSSAVRAATESRGDTIFHLRKGRRFDRVNCVGFSFLIHRGRIIREITSSPVSAFSCKSHRHNARFRRSSAARLIPFRKAVPPTRRWRARQVVNTAVKKNRFSRFPSTGRNSEFTANFVTVTNSGSNSEAKKFIGHVRLPSFEPTLVI